MGLSDTLVNPISQNPVANSNNCFPPPPTQTPASNGCFPNYAYPPACAPRGHLANGMYNSGGGVNGSGIQKNGGSKVGNWSQKTGGVNIDSIGSNIGNQCGKQVVGDVAVGNIG